jgi:hypothetical protein
MANSKFDADMRITERDWLKVQLDLYSLKTRGSDFSTYFQVEWTEVICNIHSKSIESMRRAKMTKEKHEEFFLAWAKAERQYFSDVICQFPTLSKLFNLDRNFTININDDYGKGAVTVCTIRGGEIVSHLFEDDFRKLI